MRNGLYIGTYPLKIAFLGAILGFIILQVAFKTIKTRLQKKDMFCEVEIQIDGKTEKLKAMIDTGNLLKEPLSGSPVVVVEKEELLEIIPQEILNNAEKIISGECEINLDEYASKFRVIPFTSLGK